MVPRARLALAFALLCSGASGAATAHRLAFPKQTTLIVEARRVLLVLRYALPAGAQARRLRAAYDRDRSGRLDGDEKSRALGHVARLALLHFEVTLDGRARTPVVRHQSALGLDDATSSQAPIYASFVVEVRAPWRRGQNVVRVTDRHPDRAIAVPLRVFVTPPLVLRATTLGRIAHGGRILEEALLREGMSAELRIEAPR